MTKKPTILQVFAAIERERFYQDREWGTIKEHPHTVGEWLLIMIKELQEAHNAWCNPGDQGALEEILQVVSVGTACLQQHGIVERDLCEGCINQYIHIEGYYPSFEEAVELGLCKRAPFFIPIRKQSFH